MDTKVTLSFDVNVIEKAKDFAANNGVSLSRLTEYLYDKITANPKQYKSLEDIPIADFVHQLVKEEAAVYNAKSSSKKLKQDYYESKK